MTGHDDTTRRHGSAGGGQFDDDRLLAFALGLEDDPALRAASESDPALRQRLAAMRADVAAVGAGLDRVVPAPPDDYGDLSDPRWGALRDLVAAPAPAAPRRRPFWVRVLAPAVAIGLVLLAGVVGVQHLAGGGGTFEVSTSAGGEKSADGYLDEGGALQGDASGGAAEATDGAAAPTLAEGAPDPSAYLTVLVARARPPSSSRQRFDVLRVLRGDAREYSEGTTVTLGLVDRAVAPDRLVVLYLTPVPAPSPATTAGGSATATPRERSSSPAIMTYRYRGAEGLALQLPPGTDPGALALP